MEAVNLTEDDWDLIHKLKDEYYEKHKKLVILILSKTPSHCKDQLLMMMSDCNSPYSVSGPFNVDDNIR